MPESPTQARRYFGSFLGIREQASPRPSAIENGRETQLATQLTGALEAWWSAIFKRNALAIGLTMRLFRVYCENVFTTKDTKFGVLIIRTLRVLRDLRGEQNNSNVIHYPHKSLKNQQ